MLLTRILRRFFYARARRIGSRSPDDCAVEVLIESLVGENEALDGDCCLKLADALIFNICTISAGVDFQIKKIVFSFRSGKFTHM